MLKRQNVALANSEAQPIYKSETVARQPPLNSSDSEIRRYLDKYKIEDPRKLKYAGDNNRRSERLNLFDPNQKFRDSGKL